MLDNPLPIEKHFTPGFKTKPAVHVGSQTIPFFHGNPEEQAWEGFVLAGAGAGDLTVVREMDADYLGYWRSLMPETQVINLKKSDLGKYLTEAILGDQSTIDLIKKTMALNAKLLVFQPTKIEKELADRLNIPLHGKPFISEQYGTKSGIRRLAEEAGILMAPGFICSTAAEAQNAVTALADRFKEVVIKHDLSISGYFMKKMSTSKLDDLELNLDKIAGGKFAEGRDTIVVEGWVKNKAVLCAHIEILENQEPVVCAGWQQIIDKDGISYLGAGPLTLSPKAMKSFYASACKLAQALKAKGAIGSFGPDFIISDEEERNFEPETCVLVELNARVPYTAFPLELIKNIKGVIGAGFCSTHIKLPRPSSFKEIKEALRTEGLLITSKGARARGVVPFNAGLLPWNIFDIAAMADSWEETLSIVDKVKKLFKAR